MHIKLTIIIASILLLISACHPKLNAVDMKSTNPKSMQEESPLFSRSPNQAFLQQLQKGEVFRSARETYQILPELYGVPDIRTTSQSQKPRLDRTTNDSPESELVLKKGPFLIYRSATIKRAALSVTADQTQLTYPVVLNQRTQTLGILSGTLKVKVKNSDDAEILAKTYGLTIKRKFPRFKLVFFQTAPGQNLLTLNEELSADPKTAVVTIEIIEHIRTPL